MFDLVVVMGTVLEIRNNLLELKLASDWVGQLGCL